MPEFAVYGIDVLDNANVGTTSGAGNDGQGTINVTGGNQPFEDDDIVVVTAENLSSGNEITAGSVISDITVYDSLADFQAGIVKFNYAPQNPGQTATVQSDLSGLGDGYVRFNANVLKPQDGGPSFNQLLIAPGKDLAVAAQEPGGLTIDRNEDFDFNDDGDLDDPLEEGNNQFLVGDYVTAPICFAKGTLIRTPAGERAVEDLRPGDRVITLHHGTQQLVSSMRNAVAGFGKMAPVRIAAGHFGATRDLMVSQNHRILCQGPDIELMFETPKVLVAAKHLVGHPGVSLVPCARITYVHLQFSRHEVIWANGCASESLFAAPKTNAMRNTETDQQDELLSIFPELVEVGQFQGLQPAQRCLTKSEAAALHC